MTFRRFRMALLPALLVAGVLAFPAGASAAGTFFRGFSDAVLTGPDRAQWYDRAGELGINLTRIDIAWNAVASQSGPPANPTDPGDPSYNFDRIDQGVREAAARGVPVIFTIQFAPNWALGPNPSTSFDGVWKPDPEAFGDFVQALATRYSGSYSPDALQPPLPEVKYLEPWNEPNLPHFLSPQWKGPKNDKPASPDHYRKMLNAAYDAAHAANPDIKVIAGATSPFGDDPGHGPRIRPLNFLREVMCLRKRGGDLEKAKCKEKAQLDAISHHPIDTEGGPRRSAISPDDATVPDFKNVVATLRAAERKRTIAPKGRGRPAWATEVWWETQPPDRGDHAFPQPKVARWIPEMFYSLREQGAQAAIWLQLIDSEIDEDGLSGYQSGIFNHDGTAKPLAAAWRFPFYADRVGKRSVRAWSIPPGSGRLAVEERRGGGWKTIATMNATAMRPVQRKVRVKGGAELRATLNGETSPTTRTKSARAARRAETRSRANALRDALSQGPVDPLENPYLEIP